MTKPKLLLDENIGSVVAEKLSGAGYDVVSILTLSPGMDDVGVLNLAVHESRILVTLDNDFGNLIFHQSHKHVGVIFLRLKRESSETVFDVLTSVLVSHADSLVGKFVTATESSIRIR